MFLLHDRTVAVLLVNSGLFLQLFMESDRRKTESDLLGMATSTNFQAVIFFYCLSFFNEGLQRKTLTVLQTDIIVKLMGFCKQLFSRTGRNCKKAAVNGSSKAIASLMLLGNSKCPLQALVMCIEELPPL